MLYDKYPIIHLKTYFICFCKRFPEIKPLIKITICFKQTLVGVNNTIKHIKCRSNCIYSLINWTITVNIIASYHITNHSNMKHLTFFITELTTTETDKTNSRLWFWDEVKPVRWNSTPLLTLYKLNNRSQQYFQTWQHEPLL